MHVVLNGQLESIPNDARLESLLARRKPRPPFAVEVNKKLVRRAEYAHIQLQDGDQVEIVTLVGGG